VKINVVTIFPEFFAAPLALSIPARAAAAGLVTYRVVDLRDHTHDRHRTVDDAPYGGGPGMVMKPEPFYEAIDALEPSGPIVLMSARGRRFSQADAVRFGDSFWERGLSGPSYTRPPEYRGHSVPDVLLSGDHKKIAEWRQREGERLTRERRARDAGGN